MKVKFQHKIRNIFTLICSASVGILIFFKFKDQGQLLQALCTAFSSLSTFVILKFIELRERARIEYETPAIDRNTASQVEVQISDEGIAKNYKVELKEGQILFYKGKKVVSDVIDLKKHLDKKHISYTAINIYRPVSRCGTETLKKSIESGVYNVIEGIVLTDKSKKILELEEYEIGSPKSRSELEIFSSVFKELSQIRFEKAKV